MSKELEPNKPQFLERLRRGNLPLVKQMGEVNANDESVRQALELIWSVADFFTGGSPGGSVTLSAPSSFLVEMGLVSEKTAQKIEERVTRKLEEGGKEEDVFNQIEIVNRGDGFELRESYIVEETFEGGNRLDRMVVEQVIIRKTPEGKFLVKINRLSTGEHLHALGRIWTEINKKPSEASKAVVLTGRRINTILAILSGWYEGWQGNR